MNRLTEGDLEITFPDGAGARRFDDASHGLSHCMKAVDFIVELNDRIVFIEIKDPEHPEALPRDSARFVEAFRSGNLDGDLTQKLRDSFLYEWGCEKVSKPIHYWIIIAHDALDDAQLLTRTDALRRRLPVRKASPRKWKRHFVEDCMVFNIEAWNRLLPGGWGVSRIGSLHPPGDLNEP